MMKYIFLGLILISSNAGAMCAYNDYNCKNAEFYRIEQESQQMLTNMHLLNIENQLEQMNRSKARGW